MTTADRLRDLLARGMRALAWLSFLPPLLTRLLVGQAFYEAGGGKLENPERVAAFFTSLGIPMPELNAAFVSRVEYYGGILLVLGLLTRLAALFLASTMAVALLTAHREEVLEILAGTSDAGMLDVVPVAYLAFLLWLLLFGPGVVSLDAALKRLLGLRDGPVGSEDAPAP